MKLLYGAMILACAPLALAGNGASYPTEKVAAFVVEKLDVTTFPTELRPKREKGKKTLGDYGYVTRNVDEKEALVEAADESSRISIRVLEQTPAGIYVCVDGRAQNASNPRFQRVLQLKRKDANGLLKSREPWKDFDGCPVIGGEDNNSQTSYN